jgi:glycosyltransferase involved in cell wall biosynthesis
MKIAIISGVFFPQPGGAQVQIHNLANKLVEQGHEVDCYIFRETNLKNNKYNIIKINYLLTSISFFIYYYLGIQTNFFLNLFIKKKIKLKYDFWYFSFLNFKSLLIINTLKNYKQKIAVCFHGIDLQIDKKINYGYRLNEKYNNLLIETLNKINVFFSISKNMYDDLINLNINKDKIFFVPNSIEITKFKLIKEYKSKTLNLITVARFAEKKKGFDLVKNISLKLIDKKIKFKWMIVGKNVNLLSKDRFFDENKVYFNFIENIQNIDEDYFPNSKLIKLYKSSDLYLNLSRIESFGVTIIEALASEIPVITFNTKGGNELIINNFNGIVVQKNNLDEFVEAIQKFEEDSYYKRIKLNTIKSILNYDLNKVAKQTIDVFEKFS